MEWLPIPVFLLGELHEQRSLVGYSPQGSQRVRHNWVTNIFIIIICNINIKVIYICIISCNRHKNRKFKGLRALCHFLFQGIFPTQGSNPGLPCCRWIFYQLSQLGSPGILEWVAYLFSSGSSRPRNQTGVSCIAGKFLTSWVTREAIENWKVSGQYDIDNNTINYIAKVLFCYHFFFCYHCN